VELLLLHLFYAMPLLLLLLDMEEAVITLETMVKIDLLHFLLFEGKQWIKTMLLTATLFPGTCFGVAFLLNFIALGYRSLAAIPFGTMIAVSMIWYANENT
jgi:hypothetical protein